jgi:hypothetical protein
MSNELDKDQVLKAIHFVFVRGNHNYEQFHEWVDGVLQKYDPENKITSAEVAEAIQKDNQ